MTDKMLVAVDGALLFRRALGHAREEPPEASITVRQVVDLFEPGDGASPDVGASYEPLTGSEEWCDRAEEVSTHRCAEARALADEGDSEVSTSSEIGDP